MKKSKKSQPRLFVALCKNCGCGIRVEVENASEDGYAGCHETQCDECAKLFSYTMKLTPADGLSRRRSIAKRV